MNICSMLEFVCKVVCYLCRFFSSSSSSFLSFFLSLFKSKKSFSISFIISTSVSHTHTSSIWNFLDPFGQSNFSKMKKTTTITKTRSDNFSLQSLPLLCRFPLPRTHSIKGFIKNYCFQSSSFQTTLNILSSRFQPVNVSLITPEWLMLSLPLLVLWLLL